MNITILHNGAIQISTIFQGQRVEQTYYGYTKKEAKQLFMQELNMFRKSITNN